MRLRAEGPADIADIGRVVAAAFALVRHSQQSEAAIDGADYGWVGLGPVAVDPAMQRRGIGEALIRDGPTRVRSLGAAGCVVLGDPRDYARFGFAADLRLTYPGPPAAYFQSLAFDAADATGEVAYHPGFAAR